MAITAEHREKMAAGRLAKAEAKYEAQRQARDDFRAAVALERETYERRVRVRELHGTGSPEDIEARRDWTDAWHLIPRLSDLPPDNDDLWDEP